MSQNAKRMYWRGTDYTKFCYKYTLLVVDFDSVTSYLMVSPAFTNNEFFFRNGWPVARVTFCCQLAPLLKIFTIVNLRHVPSKLKPGKKLNLGFVVWSCGVVITTVSVCKEVLSLKHLNRPVTIKQSQIILKFRRFW